MRIDPPRNHRRPIEPNRGQQPTRMRVRLTTELAGTAQAKRLRWVAGQYLVMDGSPEITIYDPFESGSGYPEYAVDTDVYVTYVRGACRWEIVDGPCQDA